MLTRTTRGRLSARPSSSTTTLAVRRTSGSRTRAWGALLASGLAAGAPANALNGWRNLEGDPCGCCTVAEPVLRIDVHDAGELSQLSFLPPSAPERVVYNLGVALATERMDLYTVLLDGDFVFENCTETMRLGLAEDLMRVRRIFAHSDATECVFVVGAARPSTHPRFPAARGFVEVATCWDLVRLTGGLELREEPNLYILRRVDRPDAGPTWLIAYWLDLGPCYPQSGLSPAREVTRAAPSP